MKPIPAAIQAIVVDPQKLGSFGFQAVEPPAPKDDEVLVRVKSISLNRGKVVYLAHGAPGTRLGWDLAGIVEKAAADGSGPALGTRVVCGLSARAWAELAAVPTNALAELPPSVSFAQAATLPCAGLTALHATEHGGSLIARPVLVTGASGGVGLFACRLAVLAGARVVGQVRRSESRSLVEKTGAEQVVVGEGITPAARHGPYHLIVEHLGGQILADAVSQLALGGRCVSVGGTANQEVTIDRQRVHQTAPGARLEFLNLYVELMHESASVGLRRLVDLVGSGKLVPHIGIEGDWREIGKVAQALVDRQFPGKAVLHLP